MPPPPCLKVWGLRATACRSNGNLETPRKTSNSQTRRTLASSDVCPPHAQIDRAVLLGRICPLPGRLADVWLLASWLIAAKAGARCVSPKSVSHMMLKGRPRGGLFHGQSMIIWEPQTICQTHEGNSETHEFGGNASRPALGSFTRGSAHF